MRNLESRDDDMSKFLKKITEVRKKCWEDLSRVFRPGRCSRQSWGSPHDRGVTKRKKRKARETKLVQRTKSVVKYRNIRVSSAQGPQFLQVWAERVPIFQLGGMVLSSPVFQEHPSRAGR